MREQQTTERSWLSAISSMFQFILGFLVGVTLIASIAAGAAFYYFKRISSTTPEKPSYTEETVQKSEPNDSEQTTTSAVTQPETTQPQEIATTEQQAKPEAKPELPEGAYYATVTWPQGLSLRADPSLNAARIGGISHDARIIILEESSDKRWQKVRIPWSQQEGWVKGGNTKRASY